VAEKKERKKQKQNKKKKKKKKRKKKKFKNTCKENNFVLIAHRWSLYEQNAFCTLHIDNATLIKYSRCIYLVRRVPGLFLSSSGSDEDFRPTIIVFSPDSPATRSRRSIGSGGGGAPAC
jgi:hypothetical protein